MGLVFLFSLLSWDSLVSLLAPLHHATPQTLLTLLAAVLLSAAANAHVRLTTPNVGEALQGGQIYQAAWFDLISHGAYSDYHARDSI